MPVCVHKWVLTSCLLVSVHGCGHVRSWVRAVVHVFYLSVRVFSRVRAWVHACVSVRIRVRVRVRMLVCTCERAPFGGI